jgi:hypothetical protein
MIRHPTPRLFIPKMILPGKSPIGSSIFRTLKKTELQYRRVLNILRNWFLASSFDKCSWMQQQSTWVIEVSHILSNANLDHKIYYSLQVSAWIEGSILSAHASKLKKIISNWNLKQYHFITC